jgi:hypothetical protein
MLVPKVTIRDLGLKYLDLHGIIECREGIIFPNDQIY